MAPPPIEQEPKPSEQVEEFLSNQDFIKYVASTEIISPDGERFTINNVNVEMKTITLRDERGESHVFKPSELEEWERRLFPHELDDQQFFNVKEGFDASVLKTNPEKNTVTMVTQDLKQFDVSFNDLLKNYRELPDDVYAPFLNTVIEDAETHQPIYIERISSADGKAVIQDCEPVVHKATGAKVGIVGNPRTSREIDLKDFLKKYKRYSDGVKYIYGDLPDFVETTITVQV